MCSVCRAEGGRRADGSEERDVVLAARHPNISPCLVSMSITSSGPAALSIMHECHNQYSQSAGRGHGGVDAAAVGLGGGNVFPF